MNVARRSRQKQSVEITGGWLVGHLGNRGHVDLLVLGHERGAQDRHNSRNGFIGDLLTRKEVGTAVEVHLSGVVVGILPTAGDRGYGEFVSRGPCMWCPWQP